jgi:hypothetical protein
MVSVRCTILLEDELNKLGLLFTQMELGSVVLLSDLTAANRLLLSKNLQLTGLELQVNRKAILVEKIKHALIGWVDFSQYQLKEKYSTYLRKVLNYEYNYLANIFKEVEGISIQNFLIRHKVELIKDLISYGELNLNQIAHRLNYSSGAHLSTQFKKNTGFPPSFFKNLRD